MAMVKTRTEEEVLLKVVLFLLLVWVDHHLLLVCTCHHRRHLIMDIIQRIDIHMKVREVVLLDLLPCPCHRPHKVVLVLVMVVDPDVVTSEMRHPPGFLSLFGIYPQKSPRMTCKLPLRELGKLGMYTFLWIIIRDSPRVLRLLNMPHMNKPRLQGMRWISSR